MLKHHVHAMGCHYASFNQEFDAQKWAKTQSKKYTNSWWEVRNHGNLAIAYGNNIPVFGHENNIIFDDEGDN